MGLHSSSIADPRKGQYEKNKCHKKLRRLVGEALTDYGMLEEGDKVLGLPLWRQRLVYAC